MVAQLANKMAVIMPKIFSLSSVFIFGIITAILLASCATIFHGSTDTVSFSSDPSASKVYVNGNLLGTTPVQLQLKSKNTYTLEFKKDGFETKTIVDRKSTRLNSSHLGISYAVFCLKKK